MQLVLLLELVDRVLLLQFQVLVHIIRVAAAVVVTELLVVVELVVVVLDQMEAVALQQQEMEVLILVVVVVAVGVVTVQVEQEDQVSLLYLILHPIKLPRLPPMLQLQLAVVTEFTHLQQQVQ